MTSCSIGVLSYNESKNMPEVVKALADVFKQKTNIDGKIIIIDNGSTDDTAEVVKNLEEKYDGVSHIKIKVNQGYGYGVKQCLNQLDSDICGFIWGDNQFDAHIVREMLDKFENPNIKFVKTYRRKRYDGQYRVFISSIYQVLFKLIHGGKIKDINSGPKIFRKDLLKAMLPLKSDDWFIDAEIMIHAVKNLKPEQIIELPIDFHPRKHGKSNVRFNVCIEFFKNLLKSKFSKK